MERATIMTHNEIHEYDTIYHTVGFEEQGAHAKVRKTLSYYHITIPTTIPYVESYLISLI